MARTEELIRREIITMQEVRFQAKNQVVRRMAHDQIMTLRAELAAVKAQGEENKQVSTREFDPFREINAFIREVKAAEPAK